MNRCLEPGWVAVACPDGRRGLWIRTTDRTVELCAGRDGDDAYVSFRCDEVQATATRDVVSTALYAYEVACENVLHGSGNPNCKISFTCPCLECPDRTDDGPATGPSLEEVLS